MHMNYSQIMSPRSPFASKSGGHDPPAPMGAPPLRGSGNYASPCSLHSKLNLFFLKGCSYIYFSPHSYPQRVTARTYTLYNMSPWEEWTTFAYLQYDVVHSTPILKGCHVHVHFNSLIQMLPASSWARVMVRKPLLPVTLKKGKSWALLTC